MKGTIFQHSEQLRLKRKGHRGDLVEKQDAAACPFGVAKVTLVRAGKRALFMSENFALEEFRGDRRTIHGHERIVGSR